MIEILDSLNKAQREAVSSIDQNLLVLAGAGSGKTRVLVHRIAWLMEQGASPFSILAVTFTNKAANEMRQRIQSLNRMTGNSMWIGTFHSLAHRFLRLHYKEAGLPNAFQIIDAEDQNRLIKRILKTFELDPEKWQPKSAQSYINNKKESGLRPHHIDNMGLSYERTMIAIYKAYEDICQQSGLVDFSELLLRSHELWLKNPDLLSHYQNRFAHILVDEFQDTNKIQYAWLKMLGGAEHSRFTMVGDDDQSIYAWRGAKVENIAKFENEFENVKVVRLEQNYRSTGHILKAANQLISNNHERMGKNLWTDAGNGDPITLYSAFNDQDEAGFIASRIKDWTDQGYNYDECAILYRSNAQSRVLEDMLIQRRIPYRIYGGLKFFDRAEIKDALAYLRLAHSFDNDAAFERIINVPTRGIGAKTVDEIRELARESGNSLWKAAKTVVQNQALSARACNALSDFLNMIEQFSNAKNDLKLFELTEQVLMASGLLNLHAQSKHEKARMRLENLEELVSATKEFESSLEEIKSNDLLTEFLAHAALEAGDNQADDNDRPAVQLMTLHSAKGLEFPIVFLAGLEEGLFPHQMALKEQGLEEERRLCYVGMTRAMKKLCISYAGMRRLHGLETHQKPSRFIYELPQDLLEFQGMNARRARPMSFSKKPEAHRGQTSNLKMPPSDTCGFQIGQNVMHDAFGEGVVMNIEGSGPRARIQVNFRSKGIKWLIIEMAKLKPL